MRLPLACLILGFQLLPSFLMANPSGEQVVAGSVDIERAGSTLTATQSTDKAIINWQDFSIASGELTKFIQPSASSAVLNRVMGDNLSSIYGTLQSNGQVFLINPNGIVVGSTGVINTAGFIASTQDVANQDFLSGGNLQFSGTSTAAVTNLGSISATGGNVFLIASEVRNAGSIQAPEGVVGLAGGTEVLLTEGTEKLFVQPGLPAGGTVENTGLIEAAAAELKAAGGNIYALAIKNAGTIRATGSEMINGRVMLKASGGNLSQTGTVQAINTDGRGGEIELAGGIRVGQPGTVTVGGTLDASAQGEKQGGKIQVTGQQIKLESDALLEANGATGGGTILVGGDYQGGNGRGAKCGKTFCVVRGPDSSQRRGAGGWGAGDFVGGRLDSILWGDRGPWGQQRRCGRIC
ncbi:MAG: filamentous hemagglutinin N-terminal domain-containing protein [Blastochloris sp.]|nr:filamentous hemagglutinin N-terminal domain-containing protein [Blastochloris sp.]